MKQFDFFLMFGALGVGKTTVGSILKDDKRYEYDFYELDAIISKKVKKPISEYFNEIGMYKFYDVSLMQIERLFQIRENLGFNAPNSPAKPMIIDVGSGCIYDYRAKELLSKYNSIVLTADPEYLFNTRNKAQDIYKELGYYKTWQFGNEKQEIYSSCDINVDVSYLDAKQVAEIIHCKLKNFMDIKISERNDKHILENFDEIEKCQKES